MSFQLNESLTLLKMELSAKRFFDFLCEMGIEKKLDVPLLQDIPMTHVGGEKHQALIAVYNAFFAMLNRSMTIKRQFMELVFIEEAKAIEELHLHLSNILKAMEGLKQPGFEDVLSYFLQSPRCRSILYYLMISNLLHKPHWLPAHDLSAWIEALKPNASATERNMLDMYQSMLASEIVIHSLSREQIDDSEVYLTYDFDPAHHAIALFAIEEYLKNFPRQEQGIPKFFLKMMKLQLSFDFFDCLSRCDERLSTYEYFTRLLTAYEFIPQSFSEMFKGYGKCAPTSWLLAHKEYYQLNLSFYCSKDELSPQTIRLNHLQWRIFLSYDEPMSMEAYIQFALNSLNFLSHNQLPNSEIQKNKFMDAMFKLFTIQDFNHHGYTNLLARSSVILLYQFLSEGRVHQAIEILETLMIYNQSLKKKLLSDKTGHHTELLAFLKVLGSYPQMTRETELLQCFHFIHEKMIYVKDFKPKPLYKDLPDLLEILKELLIAKVFYWSAEIKKQPISEALLELQQYVFKMAKRLDATAEQIQTLELCFGKKEIALDEFDEKSSVEKTVSGLSFFKDTRKFVDNGQLPISILTLYQLIKQFKVQQGGADKTYLWLFGGQARHFYLNNKANPNADYDLKAWDLNLQSFWAFLQQEKFGVSMLVEAHVPVIRIRVAEQDSVIEIDLQSFGQADADVEVSLRMELFKCDFSVSSAYLEINDEEEFEIRGFNKAIASLNKKKISLNHPDAIEKDPLILLRLVHLCLSDCELKVSVGLSEILKSGVAQKSLEVFLQDDTHGRQFITQLKKSLSKINQRDTMVTLMQDFGFFEIWTGLTVDEIREGMQHLPALNEQLKLSIPLQLVEYFYIYLSMKLGSFDKVKETTFYRLTRCFAPQERLFFRYIDLLLWEIPMNDFVNAPEIIALKDIVEQQYFQDTSTISASSS